MSDDAVVFWLVLSVRLLLPLLVFRFPIVGILTSLVLDGVDQTVFQTFTTLDLTNYQSYDKALDVFYLSLAYVATMRNWVSGAAFRVARLLFYYRLVGVMVFELTGAEHRTLMLLFPNTFEYFFVFYEVVRSRWDPARGDMRFWAYAAVLIWVGIKIPQEYWIHVAQLDVTDSVAAYPLAAVLVLLVALAAVAVTLPRVRPHVPAPDHPTELAAGPLPPEMGGLEERLSYRLRRGRVFTLPLLEKIILVSLVTSIFAELLPSVEATLRQVTVAVAVVVTVNASLYLFTARRGWGIASALWSFAALAAFNVALVAVARLLQSRARDLELPATLFFVALLTLVVSTYDRYRPVLDTRLGRDVAGYPG